MGTLGAGARMQFLSGTYTMSYFALKYFKISVNMAPEHPFTKSSVFLMEQHFALKYFKISVNMVPWRTPIYQIVHLPMPL